MTREDQELREIALDKAASLAVHDEGADGIVTRAEVFEVYLRGRRSLPGQRAEAFTSLLDGAETLRDATMTTVGAASMCWAPKPTGTFDSERAAWVGEQLVEWMSYHEDDAVQILASVLTAAQYGTKLANEDPVSLVKRLALAGWWLVPVGLDE